MNKRIKIYTHSGVFHADEVFAIALIEVFTKLEIEVYRTRDEQLINNAKKENDCMLIDLGSEYDISRKLFDHHQSDSLPASNVLILNYLFNKGLIDNNVYPELLGIMQGISDWDINANEVHQRWDYSFVNVSMLISAYNINPKNNAQQDIAFGRAINVAVEYLRNQLRFIETKVKSKKDYESGNKLSDKVIMFDSYNSFWKQAGEFPFAVMPNDQGYMIMSLNSSKWPLPEIKHKDLIFLHNARFIAIFKTKEAALEVAKKL